MKIKKEIILVIISTMLILIPAEVFAWLAKEAYIVCNPINMIISNILKLIAFIIAISYITMVIRHIRQPKQDTNEKTKNILVGLIIAVTEIFILLLGAYGVTKAGMELYEYPTGQRYQTNIVNVYISNVFKIMALIAIITYIIKSVIYFVRSEEERYQKIKNIIKWQTITAIIVITLLFLSTI